MRLFFLLGALTVFAASTFPSAKRSAAVLTGKVLWVQKITDVTNGVFSGSEVWRAQVKVQSITKQDTNLTGTVFLYYGQDGPHHFQACPSRPKITVGDTKMFYCVRGDIADAQKVLVVPEGDWVTEP